jgi:1-acyl-sn-glycerol-3-phosphate acyltransferase
LTKYRNGLIRLLRHIGQALYGIYFWGVFSICAVLALVLLTFLPGQQLRRTVARKAAAAVFRLTGSWPEIEGTEHLPDWPIVIVANHASYLDGPLLTAVLPERFQFVVKREVMRVPVVHFFLRRLGTHFVERFDPHRGAADARRIMSAASSDASLAFFPEGTFYSEPGLRQFHSGAFAIARRRHLPVIPVVICGTRRMLPSHRLLPSPTRLKVIVTPALNGGQIIEETQAAIAASRTQILRYLDEPDLLGQ